MAGTIPALPTLVTPGDLGDEMGAFVRHLRADHLSPNSVYAYVGAVVSLGNYLLEHDLPTDVAAIGASTSRTGRSASWSTTSRPRPTSVTEALNGSSPGPSPSWMTPRTRSSAQCGR